MTAPSSNVERRPMPSVAIVGNDAVLAAAPATPVQLAHACLKRGFSVAVPASWGDELLATETVRRLVGREKGPAVMCVCPFVRSRLLASGADLAPFLVSLVAPPVAVARYLRAVYGEHGVHITYIGGCPGAEDPSIDDRLTPDTFFADLADHGIALSEQPLVFDSIMPPDRRRWYSAPGGVPSPDVLWNEADGRTLVEIDRDDISTDLAQHIITHENVLIDLAPGLGCVCSGAIPSVPARSARVAVIALEPPRALGPVIDSSVVVPLDAPVDTPRAPRPTPPDAPTGEPATESSGRALTADVLDMEIGRPVWKDVASETAEPESGATEPLVMPPGPVVTQPTTVTMTGDEVTPRELWGDHSRERHTASSPAETSNGARDDVSALGASIVAPASAQSTHHAAEEFDSGTMIGPADVIVAESDVETLVESLPDTSVERRHEVPASEEPGASPVRPAANVADRTVEGRRRTPVSVLVRHPASAIPKATASDGKSLPRAYVARRRLTLTGVAAAPSDAREVAPAATLELPTATTDSAPDNVPVLEESVPSSAPAETPPAATDTVADEETVPPDASGPTTTAPTSRTSDAPAPPTGHQPSNTERALTARREQTRSSAASSSGDHDPLVIAVVVAFVALAAFVVWTLQS